MNKLRFIMRDGEKILQEYVLEFEGWVGDSYRTWGEWVDIPLVEEEDD